MNNTPKYLNLIDYSGKLNQSIKSFDTAIWSTQPKQLGSLNVTLNNLRVIMENLREVQRLIDNMRLLPSLDSVAKKDNKFASRAAEQMMAIRENLAKSYESLQEDFFKTISLAGEQCNIVKSSIKDEKDKERFADKVKPFQMMVFEAKTNSGRIPFYTRDYLAQYRQKAAYQEHRQDEKVINSALNNEINDTKVYEDALNKLTQILAVSPHDRLSNDIRKEVSSISKVLSPKTISIAKEGLDKLRHSSQLIADLDKISETLSTTYSFAGSKGGLSKIDKQIAELKNLVSQALTEERNNNQDIKKDNDASRAKIDLAAEALQAYGNILRNNNKVAEDKVLVGNGNHELVAENKRLEEDRRNSLEEARNIRMVNGADLQDKDAREAQRLDQVAARDREMINQNNKEMAAIMNSSQTLVLPEKYKEMKKKLQNASSLYQMRNLSSLELQERGTSR